MTDLDAALARGFALFQQGDLQGAAAQTAPYLQVAKRDPRLAALQGQILLAANRPADAVPYLKIALAAAPGHGALTTKLVSALVASGALEEARRVATAAQAVDLCRTLAAMDQQQGRPKQAIDGYRQVVRLQPADHQSWYVLGVLLQKHDGDHAGAVTALERAVRLNPGQAAYHVALSQLLGQLARHDERRAVMGRAVAALPPNPDLWVELSVAEGALDDFAAAEAAFEKAVSLSPANAAAYRERAMVLERLSRLDELQALLERARSAGVEERELAFPAALLHLRYKRFAAAEAALIRVESEVNPARLHQARAEVADGQGRYAEAFAAYSQMNAASADEPLARHALAMDFPADVRQVIAHLGATTGGRWALAKADPDVRAPVFLIGFPRSGTTLIDTMLRNIGSLRVLEEPPMLEAAMRAFDGQDLSNPSVAAIETGRRIYFETLAAFDPSPESDERRLVDKFPLHMVRAPAIHHLFPGAPILFLERHPCDAVLSCFFARFQNNKAMVQFQSLKRAAELYNLSMEAWTRSESLLPLNVHHIRYEDMVRTPEPVLRGTLAFLGLPWDDAVLDNQGAAASRPLIATASYAQVTQPIHSRSIARWRHYEAQLAPVMPLLRPWIERLGYDC